MSKSQLYYQLLLVEKGTDKEADFRLASELPWPSPQGTEFDLTIDSGAPLTVQNYVHQYGALYMQLALDGGKFIIETESLEEERKFLFDDGWEEINDSCEVIGRGE